MPRQKKAPKTRKRLVTWVDPAVCMEDSRKMAGPDYLSALRDGTTPLPPVCELVGFRLSEVKRGSVVFTLIPGEYHYNPYGTVHGGIIALVLDSAMGCSVQSTLTENQTFTTIDVKINFIRPLTRETGEVVCTGKIIHGGSRIATSEGVLRDRWGKIYAHGLSTVLVLPPSPP